VIDPADLAKHYTRFRVTERILLTGHSHQAWPDVAFEAQQQALLDTAEHVDDVWDLAFQKANEVPSTSTTSGTSRFRKRTRYAAASLACSTTRRSASRLPKTRTS